MKTTLKIFLFLVVALGFSATAMAQGTASATVVTPISISQGTALSFGNIVAPATGEGAGTVTISTAGARSESANIKYLNTSNISAASFTVSGLANNGFSITLPGDTDVTLDDSASHSMAVKAFASNPNGSGTLSSSGSATVTVGATLHLAEGQVPGSYSGTFAVTVAYN